METVEKTSSFSSTTWVSAHLVCGGLGMLTHPSRELVKTASNVSIEFACNILASVGKLMFNVTVYYGKRNYCLQCRVNTLVILCYRQRNMEQNLNSFCSIEYSCTCNSHFALATWPQLSVSGLPDNDILGYGHLISRSHLCQNAHNVPYQDIRWAVLDWRIV